MLDYPEARLKKKICGKQEEYELLAQKVQFLRTRLITTTDVTAQFNLEDEIRRGEARLTALEQELEALERSYSVNTLHMALAKLNYHVQRDAFLQLTDYSPIGAFLIHGKAYHGQGWLLNRLVRFASKSPDNRIIPISFCSCQRRDLSAIMRKIGEKVDLGYVSSPSEVIERICALWQNRSVILIFRDAGEGTPQSLQELKEQFWDELVQRARKQPSQQKQARLLLFLVDEAGDINDWPFPCVEQPDASWTPDIPVKPPMITPIGVADLMSWVKEFKDDLPVAIRDMEAQVIWQQTNEGTPQLVLQRLCELGNCEWLELEQAWMKY